MSIFDIKQDVIDIELTSLGKQKLVEGNFDIKYVKVVDGVLYDVSHFYSGSTESQSYVEERIKYETPYLKTINEGELKKQYDKEYYYVGGIGKRGSQDDLPLWNIRVYNTSIMSASIENRKSVINLDSCNYIVSSEYREGYESFVINDDLCLYLKDNYIFLDVVEENSDYENQNFEIQIQECETGSDGKIYYKNLKFHPEFRLIKNNILGDDYKVEEDVVEGDVNYLFDVKFDRDIETDIYFKHKSYKNDKDNIYLVDDGVLNIEVESGIKNIKKTIPDQYLKNDQEDLGITCDE